MFDVLYRRLNSRRWVLLLFVVALLLSFNGGIDISCALTNNNPISSDQCNGAARETFAEHLAHHDHDEPSFTFQIASSILVSPQSTPLLGQDARLPQPHTLPAPKQPPRSA